MNDFEEERELGSGTYGIVYLVKHRETKQRFAVKYHRRVAGAMEIREVACLKAIKEHPHVVRLHGCFADTKGRLILLLDFVPHTLRRIFRNNQPAFSIFGRRRDVRSEDRGRDRSYLPLSFVAHFSVQTAKALAYIHSINIIHRDLKPDNVMLTADLTVKVTDMGLARYASKLMSPRLVTEAYRAPELFDINTTNYTCAVDMWSLGILITEAVEGQLLFMSPFQGSLMRAMYSLADKVARAELIPKVVKCQAAHKIVTRLLTKDPSMRLLAHQMLGEREWVELARMTAKDKDTVTQYINAFD